MTDPLDALRAALTAARPAMTGEQQDAADALLAALTPPMEEPEWPSAVVMAKCDKGSAHMLHVRARAPGRGIFQWTCVRGVFPWEDLRDPRPLTDAERAEYGIPGECDRPHAEPITDELVRKCAQAAVDSIQENWLWTDVARAVLRAAGHPEVDR